MNDQNTDCLLIQDQGRVRTLTMNRPAKRNALDTALTQALLQALRAADADAQVAVIVLAGAGLTFCAGADVGEFATLTPENAGMVDARAELTTRLHAVFPAMSKPVIAAVQGRAMGGGAGLALACDLLVMAEDAQLAYPEVTRGIVPAVVMTNLVRQIGRKLAFEMAVTGRPLTAARAAELGIANRVAIPGQLAQTAAELAREIAGHSMQAVGATKQLFHAVADGAFEQGLDAGRKANIAMRAYKQ
jgi:enoyl-CoA hydratase/carnithine racemase